MSINRNHHIKDRIIPDELKGIVGEVRHVERGSERARRGGRTLYAPYLCNEVIYVIPRHIAIAHTPPPAHKVGGQYVCVCMQVVGNGYLVVSEGRGDETHPELVVGG